MSKDLIFHINISHYKRNEIATVGHPDTPELTDDYASKLVKAGWASWYDVEITTVDKEAQQPEVKSTLKDLTEAESKDEPTAESKDEELVKDETAEIDTPKKQRRRAQKEQGES